MSAIQPTTRITVQPNVVEYRTSANFGLQIITVTIRGHDPQILARTEVYRNQGSETSPMALFLSEVEELVCDAKSRLGR